MWLWVSNLTSPPILQKIRIALAQEYGPMIKLYYFKELAIYSAPLTARNLMRNSATHSLFVPAAKV
jgi:hypothetical protein